MATDKPMKLYRLLSGSITRYEGVEDKEGARKVVTYEANGDAAGNQVWLTEREVAAINRVMPGDTPNLRRVEEVHGAEAANAPAEPVVSESTAPATASNNPAVDRVLAKKAAESK